MGMCVYVIQTAVSFCNNVQMLVGFIDNHACGAGLFLWPLFSQTDGIGISQMVVPNRKIKYPVVIPAGYVQVFFVLAESQAIPGPFYFFFIQHLFTPRVEQLDRLRTLPVVRDGHQASASAYLEGQR